MKKFLFTLAALLMAVTSFAQTDAKYLYVNTALTEDHGIVQSPTDPDVTYHEIMLVISAEFPAYLNAFEAQINAPEGMVVDFLDVGEDAIVTYYQANGRTSKWTPAISVGTGAADQSHFIIAGMQSGYDYVDGVLTNTVTVKWAPGLHEKFIYAYCIVDDATYHGGDITITTKPASGQDPRTTITDLGDSQVPHTTPATEPLPDPNPVVVAPAAPVITFAGEETTEMTVTVTAEEGCTLIVNGEGILSNTYTYTVTRDDIYTPGTVNVSAYAVKDDLTSEEATDSKDFVVALIPVVAPEINYDVQTDKVVVTITWPTTDGNQIYTGEYEYTRPEYGEPDQSYDVEAYTEATETYEASAHATATIPVPAKDPVWQSVAAPVINYDVQTDKVVVTINWPTTTGNQIYTGEYEYARPEYGEPDQSYDVEAYTEADYPYEASAHATATIPVPAKAPVWQDVAAPVISYTMDDDNVYVTINWPETTGEHKYNGEYTYARPEYGEADQSYAVEAYTEADYPYSESVHATETIPVPAKEQVVPVEDNIYVKFDGTELPVGKKIIFVYENGENSYAFGPIANSKGNPVSVVVENNEVNIANTDVIEFTVGGGDVAYGTDIKQYTLEYSDGFLAYASKTDFKTMSSVGAYDTEAYWRLQSVTGGYALNNAGTASRYIRKHATSNKFGPYAVNADSEVVVIYIEKSDTPEPVAPNAPVITFAGEETTQMTVTVTAEEGCTLIVNGEAIESNTYTYTVDREDIYTEGTVNVSAYAVKDGVQSEEATGSKDFVVALIPVAAPEISYDIQADKVVVTIAWPTTDGNQIYTGAYEYTRPEYGEPDQSYDVEAYTEATETYEASAHATATIPVPAKDPVWQDVAAPEISYTMDDNNVYVTINWPETTGEHKYTGEYTYARPEYGEAAESYAVEAYTEADYPYSESVHATATIPVPAKDPQWVDGTAPVIEFNETKDGNIVTEVEVVVTGADESHVWVNGAQLRGETIAASYDEVKNIHVEAVKNANYPYMEATAEGNYKLNKLVAAPVISTEVLDDVVKVNIVWPATEGTQEYTGEYTYERGETDQTFNVEAYTTAAGDYQESFHATETINVPALEQTPDLTPEPEIIITTGKYNEKYVEITCEDPDAVIYYRTQFENGEWSAWAIYDDKMMFTVNGHYNVEAYAKNPEKEVSTTADDEFIVSNCTAVGEVMSGKTISSVRYFNLAGQEMQEANGMTIIVTTYTDGTSSAVKVMK